MAWCARHFDRLARSTGWCDCGLDQRYDIIRGKENYERRRVVLTPTPIGENRFKQLIKKVGGPGEGGADAED